MLLTRQWFRHLPMWIFQTLHRTYGTNYANKRHAPGSHPSSNNPNALEIRKPDQSEERKASLAKILSSGSFAPAFSRAKLPHQMASLDTVHFMNAKNG